MHIVISELLKAYLPISSFKYFLPFTSSFSSFATATAAAAAGASTSQPSQPAKWTAGTMTELSYATTAVLDLFSALPYRIVVVLLVMAAGLCCGCWSCMENIASYNREHEENSSQDVNDGGGSGCVHKSQ